jgi:hypothetical protein
MGKRREAEESEEELKKSKKVEVKKNHESKGLKAEKSNVSSEPKAPARSLQSKNEEGLTWIEAAEEAIDELAKEDDRDPREGWHYKNEILKKIFKIGHISTSGKTPEGTLNRIMRGRTGRAIFVAVAGKPAHYTLRRFIFSANDDAFALITDSSKFDFAHPFPLTRKLLQEFQQKVQGLSINNSLSTHLVKLLQEGIRRCRAREHESIVFLGGMSQGKSFLIDSILRLTTISRYTKEVLQVPWEERLQHMLGDIAEVFGSKQGDFQSIFDDIMKKRSLAKRKSFPDLEVSLDELKKGQKLAREIIENTVKVFPTGRKKEILHEGCFLLESCPKANKSTTPFPIFIRYGWVPAIVLRFFNDVSEVPYDDQRFSSLEEYLFVLFSNIFRCLKSHDLTIHHVTSQINARIIYFVGNGIDFDEDRLYIREKLKLISHNILLEFVTSEVIVYMPTPILQNNAQLVDCPGYLDAKPTRKKHTQRTIESAKIVWFILSKNLEHCETELSMLPRFINKVLLFIIFFNGLFVDG